EDVDSAKFFVFGLGSGEVIRGWDDGILGTGNVPPMKVGGVRRLSVPADLAYGARGAGCTKDGVCTIPPNSRMEFTVELLGIKGTPSFKT
ncbi:hypothetical protein CYMTET_24954, partial [Cymbomonas tetramitiformis]